MKWIKLAAIIGFVFAGLVLIPLILGMVGVSILSEVSSVIIIIFFVIFLVAFFFFMLGFVKTGQKTGHKLLRVSSWMIIVSAVVGVLLLLILGLMNNNFSGIQGINSDSSAQLDALFNDQNADFNTDFNYNGNSILTGNAIGDASFKIINSGAFFVFLIAFLFIFLLISVILFLVSIAEHREKIRFSRPSAFFGFLVPNSYLISLGFSVLFLFSGNELLVKLFVIIPQLMVVLTSVFFSLFLLDASKRFEGFENVAPPQEYREYSPYPPRAKVRAMTSV